MDYYMGIDGGGSTVRVVVTTRDLTVKGESRGATVNPSVVGQDAAGLGIQSAMREALAGAKLEPTAIKAIGAGVAGVLSGDVEGWLRDTIHAVCPGVQIVTAGDLEIALIGAHGERRGVILLSGTGSAAYGANGYGDTAIVGGWGYLLGDEGSGYWFGMRALRAALAAVERRGQATSLTEVIFDVLKVNDPREVVRWLYYSPKPRTKEIAAFAPLVLDAAEAGDAVAQRIVEAGAYHLEILLRSALFELKMANLPVAFTGGLLEEPNPLSRALCERLGYDGIPAKKHPAVIGAVLLAMNKER